jgi:hypothetical protein
MRVVALLAFSALIVLVIALFTGNAGASVVVIALAALGIILLVRDWRTDPLIKARSGPAASDDPGITLVEGRLIPDEFSPDLSTDPDGPSSDARADQL